MFKVSKLLFSPPKTPRNVFFPWQTMCVHRSGSFIERNRLALRVPVNLTKFEIREYLRKIYDAKVIKVNTLVKIPKIKRDFSSKIPKYYHNGPIYKKAFITLEHDIPDEVKMIGMDFELGKNPAITKKNLNYGKKKDYKVRNHDQLPNGWKLPLTNLLADDDWELIPGLHSMDDKRMVPDPNRPFVNDTDLEIEDIPKQRQVQMNLTPWRRKLQQINEAQPTPHNFPPEH